MGRYRKILVAVDGSESSANAFRQACKLVRDYKSWITVITAVPDYLDQFQTLSVKESASRALRADAERILADISEIARAEDVYISTVMAEGSPIDAIVETASDGGFDLTILGRRGKTGLESALLGSVAAGVIGLGENDVLVVPKGAVFGHGTLLLATDGSTYGKVAGKRAVELALHYGSELKIISVVDVPSEFYAEAPKAAEEMISKAKSYAADAGKEAEAAGIRTETFVREGDAYRTITGMAKDLNADLIVLGSHGRTGIQKLLMGSVTEKVIGHSPCPVLVVK